MNNREIDLSIYPYLYIYIYRLTENDPRRNHDEYVFQIRGDIEQSAQEFFEEVAGVSAVPDEHVHEHRVLFRHLLRPFLNEIPISKHLSPPFPPKCSSQTSVHSVYLYNAYNQFTQSSGITDGTFG